MRIQKKENFLEEEKNNILNFLFFHNLVAQT